MKQQLDQPDAQRTIVQTKQIEDWLGARAGSHRDEGLRQKSNMNLLAETELQPEAQIS
jgi:hypothetical protein